MNRREFIHSTGKATLATALADSLTLSVGAAEQQNPTAARLPRWRGFNLLEKFIKRQDRNPAYQESDFEIMREWGFDFVRLPMSYLCWTDPKDWRKLLEPELKDIDAVVALGRKHGIHVNLNFHRGPGYCVNPPAEPLSLWKDQEALDVCALHWAHFARRFKGISNRELSFDLLNEPPDIAENEYVRVATALVQAIRGEDPDRLVIVDGLRWGRKPVHGLAELKVGQSTRGYDPMQISHHKAGWVNGSDKWPEPSWPLKREGKEVANKETLRKELIRPWKELEQKGEDIFDDMGQDSWETADCYRA